MCISTVSIFIYINILLLKPLHKWCSYVTAYSSLILAKPYNFMKQKNLNAKSFPTYLYEKAITQMCPFEEEMQLK